MWQGPRARDRRMLRRHRVCHRQVAYLVCRGDRAKWDREGAEGLVLRYGALYGPGTGLSADPESLLTKAIRKRGSRSSATAAVSGRSFTSTTRPAPPWRPSTAAGGNARRQPEIDGMSAMGCDRSEPPPPPGPPRPARSRRAWPVRGARPRRPPTRHGRRGAARARPARSGAASRQHVSGHGTGEAGDHG
jgi:hypothetical protein